MLHRLIRKFGVGLRLSVSVELREKSLRSRDAEVAGDQSLRLKLMQCIVQPMHIFFSTCKVVRVICKPIYPDGDVNITLLKMKKKLASLIIQRQSTLISQLRRIGEECPGASTSPKGIVRIEELVELNGIGIHVCAASISRIERDFKLFSQLIDKSFAC